MYRPYQSLEIILEPNLREAIIFSIIVTWGSTYVNNNGFRYKPEKLGNIMV